MIVCIRCDIEMDIYNKEEAEGWGWLRYANGWCCRYCKAEPEGTWIDLHKHPTRKGYDNMGKLPKVIKRHKPNKVLHSDGVMHSSCQKGSCEL